MRACRHCGCTDDRACVFPASCVPSHVEPIELHETIRCWWVADDVCSFCAPHEIEQLREGVRDLVLAWQRVRRQAWFIFGVAVVLTAALALQLA